MLGTASSNSTVRVNRVSSSFIPLSLYTDPPEEELTLDQFELLSLDRLQLLRGIENLKNRNVDEQDFPRKINDVSSEIIFCSPSVKFSYINIFFS
jgi:hypothetical protein